VSALLLAAAHPSALQTATDPSIGASLMKMVLGLGGVIVSILVVSKVLQYLRKGTAPRRAATGGLEVLSRQSLGKGLQLAVVRFNGREVLVGIAGQQISFHEPTAATLEGELALLGAGGPEASAPVAASGLAGALAGLTGRGAGLQQGRALAGLGGGSGTAASFLDRLRDATTR